LLLEAPRQRGGIGVEHRGVSHLALAQSHALAVLEVDGGEQNHDRLPVDLDEQHPCVRHRLDEGDYDAGGNPVEAAFHAEQQESAADDKGENAELEQDEIEDECLPVLEVDLAQRLDLHA
jgi:hypothetical protein